MSSEPTKLDKIVSLAKRRGFVYRGSEIYGGFAGFWDYGPLGIELKRNIENLWWKMFVKERGDMYGMDAAIVMNPEVWRASGHAAGFTDPLVECLRCRKRFRSDHLMTQQEIKNGKSSSVWACPECGHGPMELRSQSFNMMFKTFVGSLAHEEYEPEQPEIGGDELTGPVVEGVIPERHFIEYDPDSIAYLRPETAQGMFVNFKNVVESLHPKLPFGLAQIGKAFRNEIAPRDFFFRTREFSQMEIEYFIRPPKAAMQNGAERIPVAEQSSLRDTAQNDAEEEWEYWFEHWRKEMWRWIDAIGLSREHVHELEVPPEDRAHYSQRTIDFEYDFPHGRRELYGLAYRGDFDLKQHMNASGVNLEYADEDGAKFLPHVIEPSLGLERTIFAVLFDAYTEDEMGGEKRVFLKLKPALAPVKVAVFPLLRNKIELLNKAKEVWGSVRSVIPETAWDDNGNIGKRYRRQDEIGTPYCVTVDFQTLEDDTVTVRDRDTGEQERVAVKGLDKYIKKGLI